MLSSARSAAKWLALGVLGSEAAAARKIDAIRKAGALTILNLHRVAPDDGSSYPPLDPAMFEALLIFASRHFELVTFADLDRPPATGKPRMILSFDDGYADFAEHAAPLLARRGIRVNHNIIPECVENGLPPLNVILQDFVGRASDDALRALEVPGFARQGGEKRGALGNRLSNFIKAKPISEQKAISDKLLPRLMQAEGFRPTPMMTLGQVREMAAVHEVGAHSFCHASLACETDQFVRQDAQACRRWFEEKLSIPMRIYAVPNGSYRAGQLSILRAAGAEQLLLVDEDFSMPASRTHKRFTFWAHSTAEMRFRATGAFRRPGGERLAA